MITAADIGGVAIVLAWLVWMLGIAWWQDEHRRVCWVRTSTHASATLIRDERWPHWGLTLVDGAYEYALIVQCGCWCLQVGLWKPEWQELRRDCQGLEWEDHA